MPPQKIRVSFMNIFDKRHPKENAIVWDILSRRYDLMEDGGADYLFASSLAADPFGYCAFDGIRILYNGENFSPDFNLFDYCLGYDYLDYGDRYFRAPLWLLYKDSVSMQTQHLQPVSKAQLAEKTRFCNFIYNHPGDGERREKMLELLSACKRVDCAGRYRNNMPDDYFTATYAEKLAFQRQCKFTLAFDSVALPGFVTEKLMHAFQSRTIPIYFGDPTVAETFNPAAFINVADYACLEDVVKKVAELDADDEAALAMLNAPVFLEEGYVTKKHRQLEAFLSNILEQNKADAYRRSRTHAAKRHNDRLLYVSKRIARHEKDSFLRRSWRFSKAEYQAGGMRRVFSKIWKKIAYNWDILIHNRSNKRKSKTM